MTRPIYEVTDPRELASLGNDVDGLFRRPAAAGGAFQLPYATLERQTNQTQNNNTNGSLFSIANTDLFTTDADVIDFFLSGGTTPYFRWRERGIYEVAIHAVYTANFDGNLSDGMQVFDETPFIGLESGTTPSFPYSYSETQTRGEAVRHVHTTASWVVVNDMPTPPAFAGVTGTFSNFSGAARTLDAATAICYQVVSFDNPGT